MKIRKTVVILAIGLLLLIFTGFPNADIKKDVSNNELQPAVSTDTQMSGEKAATRDDIHWQVVSGGGNMSTSNGNRLGCTIGQTANGIIISGSNRINSGFWQDFGVDTGEVGYYISGDISYYDPSKAIPGVSVELSGDASDTQITNVDGQYVFSDLNPGSYTITPSDTSDDAGVSVADIIKMRLHLAFLEIFDTPYKLIAGDVNCSEGVSVADIIKMRRYLAQLEDLPCGNWKFINASYAITDINWMTAPEVILATITDSDLSDSNFVGVRLGDVNNTWSPVKDLTAAKASTSPPKSIKVGDATGRPGEIVSLPIMIEAGTKVAGLELHLKYDPDQLSFLKYSSDLHGEPTTSIRDDAIHFIWEDINHVVNTSDRKPIVVYHFEILDDLSDETEIEIYHTEVVNASGQSYNVAITNGRVTRSGSSAKNVVLPDEYRLDQNRPNPFNPATEINFGLPKTGHVELIIYNITGQKVITLIDKQLNAGFHKAIWDADQAASGVYLYRIKAGDFIDTKKMVLLK